MVVPPHLPPPTCEVKHHHQLQRIKIFLAATGFGLLAGITGASIVLGWIWPSYGGGDTWIVAQQTRYAWSGSQLEEKVQREISERVVSVYSGIEIMGDNNYFNISNKLGEAVVISSDGWLAMYLPKPSLNLKRARVLTVSGSVYELEKILTDARSGLTFLKISLNKEADKQRVGGQFQVVSLVEKTNLTDDIFVYENGNWRGSAIVASIWNALPRPHLDNAPAYLYSLNGNFANSSVVINRQGRLVGFTVLDNMFLSASYLARIMPTVLDQQKVIYSSLGVSGWFDSEQPIVINSERQRNSFMVSKIESRKSALKVGDIITMVNGQIVTPENLWYNISSGKTIPLRVWREGKTIELEAPTVQI
ncbi:MAG: S1C family serine protease [Candidatus Magasanikbacteria bacterium]